MTAGIYLIENDKLLLAILNTITKSKIYKAQTLISLLLDLKNPRKIAGIKYNDINTV